MRDYNNEIALLERNINNIKQKITAVLENEANINLQKEVARLKRELQDSQKKLADALDFNEEISKLYSQNEDIDAQRTKLSQEIKKLNNEQKIFKDQLHSIEETNREVISYEQDLTFFDKAMHDIAQDNVSEELLMELRERGGELLQRIVERNASALGKEEANEFEVREIMALAAAELMDDRKRQVLNILNRGLENVSFSLEKQDRNNTELVIERYKEATTEIKEQLSNIEAQLAQKKKDLHTLSEELESNKETAQAMSKKLLGQAKIAMDDHTISGAISSKINRLSREVASKSQELHKLEEKLSAALPPQNLPRESLSDLQTEKERAQEELRKIKLNLKKTQARKEQQETHFATTKTNFKTKTIKKELGEVEDKLQGNLAETSDSVRNNINQGLDDMRISEDDVIDMTGNSMPSFTSPNPYNEAKEPLAEMLASKQQNSSISSVTQPTKNPVEIAIRNLVIQTINELPSEKISVERLKSMQALDLTIPQSLQNELQSLIRQELQDKKLAYKLQTRHNQQAIKKTESTSNDAAIAKALHEEETSLANTENDRKIAKVLQKDEYGMLTENDRKIAKMLQKDEYELLTENDRKIAEVLQKDEYEMLTENLKRKSFVEKIYPEKSNKEQGLETENGKKQLSWLEFFKHLIKEIVNQVVSKEIKPKRQKLEEKKGANYAEKVSQAVDTSYHKR